MCNAEKHCSVKKTFSDRQILLSDILNCFLVHILDKDLHQFSWISCPALGQKLIYPIVILKDGKTLTVLVLMAPELLVVSIIFIKTLVT